jgi:alkyl hydroperoxide reductase subunit AhpC
MIDSVEATAVTMPRIGDPAPAFSAETTQGPVNFPNDYAGSWVILFSHPADFTPVCTTEFMTFASMQEEFARLNTKLVGVSVDGLFSHIAWLRTIRERISFRDMKDVEVAFPLVDDSTRNVARLYGMIMPGEDSTKTVRAVFVIDPQGIVRTIVYYPLRRHTRGLAPRRGRHRAARRVLRSGQGPHGEQGRGRHVQRLVLLHQGDHQRRGLRRHRPRLTITDRSRPSAGSASGQPAGQPEGLERAGEPAGIHWSFGKSLVRVDVAAFPPRDIALHQQHLGRLLGGEAQHFAQQQGGALVGRQVLQRGDERQLDRLLLLVAGRR